MQNPLKHISRTPTPIYGIYILAQGCLKNEKNRENYKNPFSLLRYTSPLYLSAFQHIGNHLGNTTRPLTLPKNLSIQTVR